MDFQEELGRNIREIRKIRGLSLEKLSNQILERSGHNISGNLISMWERGERRMSAEQFYYLCKALDCTPNMLMPGFDGHAPARMAQEYAALPKKEQEILDYAALSWDGNTHALIQFIALYMSLPRRLREDIAFMGIHTYEKGTAAGVINPEVPEVDIAYIEEQWKKLLHKD